MTINQDDPLLWEHLGVVISTFEKEALKTRSREGAMAIAMGPLGGMEMIVTGSKESLEALSATRKKKKKAPEAIPEPGEWSAGGETSTSDNAVSSSASVEFSFPADESDRSNDGFIPNIPSVTATPGASLAFDADLNSLLENAEGVSYLKDCIGCDARLTFDWQLQPINLLGPIDNLLTQINGSLDQFDRLTNPNALLNDVCEMGDVLQQMCIPDVTMMLMAIKMTLVSYLNFQFIFGHPFLIEHLPFLPIQTFQHLTYY